MHKLSRQGKDDIDLLCPVAIDDLGAPDWEVKRDGETVALPTCEGDRLERLCRGRWLDVGDGCTLEATVRVLTRPGLWRVYRPSTEAVIELDPGH